MTVLKRKIITTSDGSSSIQIEEWDEQYHSKHGALQEAQHVFIKNGLHEIQKQQKELSILEIGFGTGLNCFLTLMECKKHELSIQYTGIEKYPITKKEWGVLNYVNQIENGILFRDEYQKLFECEWESFQAITPYFSLQKKELDFFDIPHNKLYDLIYFDAFGFRVQPHLWGQEMFDHMYQLMKNNGILVTYAAKGSVRRVLTNAGFQVERLPGPPGKREMLRAKKI